mgnify:FL=1
MLHHAYQPFASLTSPCPAVLAAVLCPAVLRRPVVDMRAQKLKRFDEVFSSVSFAFVELWMFGAVDVLVDVW